MTVLNTQVLSGALAHAISTADSEWFVEDDLDGFDEPPDARYLVVDMRKSESFVDWDAPLCKGNDASGASRRILIGGKGDAQKEATAQQLASYQILQKLPAAVRGDVYVRAPPREDGLASSKLYFVGKVIAEAAEARLSLAAQEALVKEHARLYLPSIFPPTTPDEALELWLAPGNTEMRVAQNEIALKRWVFPDGAELPAAGACGFEPETAPPAHMGVTEPFSIRRDVEGQPLAEAFEAKVVKPDQVPGAFESWLGDQQSAAD